MRLIVFLRNAGFGRCYLVSTRHEILSNIDQNRNSAAATKKALFLQSIELVVFQSYLLVWKLEESMPASFNSSFNHLLTVSLETCLCGF